MSQYYGTMQKALKQSEKKDSMYVEGILKKVIVISMTQRQDKRYDNILCLFIFFIIFFVKHRLKVALQYLGRAI